MKQTRFSTLLAAAVMLSFVLAPPNASAQALTSLSSVRVGYNTRKATVRPEGELKAQIDALDRQIAEASRQGDAGELRHLYAKGTALLAGREWTDALEFGTSLVIRAEQVVVDSAKPYAVRVEQIYEPQVALSRSLSARATLRRTGTGRGGAAAAGGRSGGGRGRAEAGTPSRTGGRGGENADIVKTFGTVDGVSRDLNESPLRLELDLAGVPDGTYQLAVDLFDQAMPLGTATLTVAVRKGLDQQVERLERAAAQAPAGLRASILYPVDRMNNVNRGRLELRTFNPEADFAAAEAVAAAARAGKDPFAGRTGDFERHHVLEFGAKSLTEPASEIVPYRLYVPKSYTASSSTRYPLIVALHGLGGTEDSFFTGYEGRFPRLAEERGYILVGPLGYRVDGFYGWGVGNPPADPDSRRLRQRSEDDVMQVLELVKQQYRIDENRIYLMGHSMGGIGTWTLAPKFPDIWAAIAPIAGSGSPDTLERIRSVPEIVVHGDADATVNVQGSRRMVAKAKELGIDVKYIEVPGGSHSGVVAPNAEAIFDFFDAHRKK